MAIRVLLAVPQPLRGELREAIAAARDCELAGTAEAPLDVLLSAGLARADVVVIDAVGGGEPPGVVSHLLTEYPDVRVLSVSGDRATLYLLRLDRISVADVSPAGLLNAIRALADE